MLVITALGLKDTMLLEFQHRTRLYQNEGIYVSEWEAKAHVPERFMVRKESVLALQSRF